MNTQRGLATNALVGLIALLVIGGGAWFIVTSNQVPAEDNVMEQEIDGDAMQGDDGAMMKTEGDVMIKHNDDTSTNTNGDAMMKKDAGSHMEASGEGATMQKDASSKAMEQPTYQGTRLAGSTQAPLLTFNQADYEAAQQAGNTVLLWYYADWCPTCKAEQAQISSAFNKFSGSGVVGFRVNINDNNTDQHEIATAREFGVSFRHTKVGVRDGQRILKTTEIWNEANYLTQLNAWANAS